MGAGGNDRSDADTDARVGKRAMREARLQQ
jgi:hypothetical protein